MNVVALLSDSFFECVNTRIRLALYQVDSEGSHGIYLVGWPICESWDRSDSRYKSIPAKIKSIEISEASELFSSQAEGLSQKTGKSLRAFVLDTRIE